MTTKFASRLSSYGLGGIVDSAFGRTEERDELGWGLFREIRASFTAPTFGLLQSTVRQNSEALRRLSTTNMLNQMGLSRQKLAELCTSRAEFFFR